MTPGTGAPKAILDANVLYVAELRDLLLTLADHGLYNPRWTRRIQHEWTRNLLQNRPDITPDRLGRTTALMEQAFPDALIGAESYEQLERDFTDLPDPDDAHVLAAAITGQCSVIVTYNLKHFPAQCVFHGIWPPVPGLSGRLFHCYAATCSRCSRPPSPWGLAG